MSEIEVEQKKIMDAADEMAAAATNFRGHGYEIFIQAREHFKELLKTLVEKYYKK
jgi:hypothetical protein